MDDAKDARYFPCPACAGAKQKDCPVCHGFGTISEECYLFGARFGKECVWSKPVAEVAEEFANGSEEETEPQELDEFSELFMPGDLVVWREPEATPFAVSELHVGIHDMLVLIYRDMLNALRLEYGEGPFRILSVDTSFIDDSDDVPQLSLAAAEGNALPRNASGVTLCLAATWFTKLSES